MKYKVILGLFLSALTCANAATVNIGGVISPSTGLVATYADGTALSAGGYYIGVGSFTTVPFSPFLNTVDERSYVNTMNIFATALSPTIAGQFKIPDKM